MPATWPPRAVIRKSAGLRTIESALYRGGLGPVAGVDEVGRGACAGPLVVAACVLGPNRLESLAALDDSKKLNERERERLFPVDPALRAGLPRRLHPVDGSRPTRGARRQHRGHAPGRRRAAASAGIRAERRVPGAGPPVPSLPVIGGDAAAACIAAASVLAKVSRDRLMVADGDEPSRATVSPCTRATARRRTPLPSPSSARAPSTGSRSSTCVERVAGLRATGNTRWWSAMSPTTGSRSSSGKRVRKDVRPHRAEGPLNR